jgi:hypothetical protein
MSCRCHFGSGMPGGKRGASRPSTPEVATEPWHRDCFPRRKAAEQRAGQTVGRPTQCERAVARRGRDRHRSIDLPPGHVFNAGCTVLASTKHTRVQTGSPTKVRAVQLDVTSTVRNSAIEVLPPFTGPPRPRAYPRVPGSSVSRLQTLARHDRRSYCRSAFSLRQDAEATVPSRSHSISQASEADAHRTEPGRGGATHCFRPELDAPHHADDAVCNRPAPGATSRSLLSTANAW